MNVNLVFDPESIKICLRKGIGHIMFSTPKKETPGFCFVLYFQHASNTLLLVNICQIDWLIFQELLVMIIFNEAKAKLTYNYVKA